MVCYRSSFDKEVLETSKLGSLRFWIQATDSSYGTAPRERLIWRILADKVPNARELEYAATL